MDEKLSKANYKLNIITAGSIFGAIYLYFAGNKQLMLSFSLMALAAIVYKLRVVRIMNKAPKK